MKLKHWVRYFLWRDTTWHGEFVALRSLLQDLPQEQKVVVDVGANDGSGAKTLVKALYLITRYYAKEYPDFATKVVYYILVGNPFTSELSS